MKKILLFGAITLVVLVIIGIIILATCLDGIVKRGVETVGPRLAQVPITLDSIHIGVLSGSATVKNLVVGNPDGYKTPSAIIVGEAEVGVDIRSALSPKIIIHAIHVKSPEITFEGGLSKNNLFQIRDNLNGASKSPAAESNGAPSTPAGPPKPAKRIEVDDFVISGAKVHVNLTTLGGREMTLPLPDIHLTDLGKGDEGLTPADLSSRVFDALTVATEKTVTESLASLGKSALGLGKDAGKSANDSLKKISSGVGGLFK